MLLLLAASAFADDVPLVAPPPAVPTIEGRVTEQGRGVPVQATLVLPDGTAVETGADDRFQVQQQPGVLITVAAPGFVTVSLPVPQSGPLRVYLRRGAGEGEIVIEARRDDPVVAEVRLDRERVAQTPGTYDDAMRIVQSLAGVAQTAEYSPRSGDIAVRGSFPGDNKYYLDGIELPYLFHYNNYASVLPTSTVDSLTLYPSTFAARFGDSTGAVIDADSVWESPDRLRGTVNLSLIMAAGGIKNQTTIPIRVLFANSNMLNIFALAFIQTSFSTFTYIKRYSVWFTVHIHKKHQILPAVLTLVSFHKSFKLTSVCPTNSPLIESSFEGNFASSFQAILSILNASAPCDVQSCLGLSLKIFLSSSHSRWYCLKHSIKPSLLSASNQHLNNAILAA